MFLLKIEVTWVIPRVIKVVFKGIQTNSISSVLKELRNQKNSKSLKMSKKHSPRSWNMVKCVKRLTQHSCFIPRCRIFSCMHWNHSMPIATYHLIMFHLLPAPWPLAFVFSLLPEHGLFFRCQHLPILIWSFGGGKENSAIENGFIFSQ